MVRPDFEEKDFDELYRIINEMGIGAAPRHHPDPAAGHGALPRRRSTSCSPRTRGSSTCCTPCCRRRSRAPPSTRSSASTTRSPGRASSGPSPPPSSAGRGSFLDSLPRGAPLPAPRHQVPARLREPGDAAARRARDHPRRRHRVRRSAPEPRCLSCARWHSDATARDVPGRPAPGGREPSRREPPAALPALAGAVHARGLPGHGPPALPAGGHLHDLPRAPPPARPGLRRQAVDRQGAGGRVRRGLGRQGPRRALPRVPRRLRRAAGRGDGRRPLHPAVTAFIEEHLRIVPRGAVPRRAGRPRPRPRVEHPQDVPAIIEGLRAGRASGRRSGSTSTCTGAGHRPRPLARRGARALRDDPEAQLEIRRGALLSLEARARLLERRAGQASCAGGSRGTCTCGRRPGRGMDGREPDVTLRQFRELRSVREQGAAWRERASARVFITWATPRTGSCSKASPS